jgi:hypothetical protein
MEPESEIAAPSHPGQEFEAILDGTLAALTRMDAGALSDLLERCGMQAAAGRLAAPGSGFSRVATKLAALEGLLRQTRLNLHVVGLRGRDPLDRVRYRTPSRRLAEDVWLL